MNWKFKKEELNILKYDEKHLLNSFIEQYKFNGVTEIKLKFGDIFVEVNSQDTADKLPNDFYGLKVVKEVKTPTF